MADFDLDLDIFKKREKQPVESESSVLRNAMQGAQSGAEKLLDVLNYPQQQMNRAILGGDRYEQLAAPRGYVDSRDMLREAGLVGQENNWGNFAAGLVGDVFFDPINLLGFVGSAGRAGRLAQKVGLRGNRLGEIATQAARRGAKINPQLLDAVEQGVKKQGKNLNNITDAEIMGRTPLRPRAAGRLTSASDLVAARDAGVEVKGLDSLLSQIGDNQRLMNQKLSRDVSLGLPGANISFNVPGGLAARQGIDSLVETAKFNPAGRLAQSVFNKNLDNIDPKLARDADTQQLVGGIRRLQDDAQSAATQRAGVKAAALYGDNAAQQIFSPEGNKAFSTLIEKPLDTKGLAGDTAILQNSASRKYADWWSREAAEELSESKKLGLVSESLDDDNLGGYLPRQLSPLIESYTKAGASGGKALSTMTGDMFARSDALKIPGGRNMIAFDLAQDNRLVGPKRLVKSDDEAADIIGQKLYGDAKAERKKTRELASLLNRLPPESMTQQTLFGQHPVENISKYMAGRAGARAGAQAQLDILASRATKSVDPSSGPAIPLTSALEKLSLRSDDGYGASDYLRKALGENARLSEYFVPERLLGSLTTGVESMSPGQFQEVATWWQGTWRNAILNWPSRYVRDLLGGLYSNQMEGALTVRGMNLARNIMKDGAHAHADSIIKMPHYANLAPQEAATQFYADLLSTDLINTGSRLDYGLAGEAVTSQFPGVEATGKGPVSQMVSSFAKSIMNLGGIFDTNSQFAIQGAKTGDISDTFNRLTGYTEKLLQGNSPDEAARIMKRTHVDYGSLSAYERHIRSNYVPFYTFMSRMLGEQARRIIEEPAKMQRTLETLLAPQRNEEDRTIKPSYISERFGFQTGRDPNTGARSYFYNFDFPGLEQTPLLVDIATGNIQGAADQAFGMLNPMLKMAAENITGTQSGFMKGQPLEQRRGSISRILQQKYPTKEVQWLDRGLEFVPYGSRLGNVAAKLTQDADEVPLTTRLRDAAISNLTGFKSQTLSVSDQLRQAERTQLENVKNTGAPVYRHQFEGVPRGAEDLLSPTQSKANDRLKAIRRTVNDRKKREQRSMNLNER